MTGQIPDTIKYRRSKYTICGVNGTGLLTPDDFGQTPVGISTANYRGYVCHYTILHKMLCLRRLTLRNKSGIYPKINAIEPSFDSYEETAEYANMKARCKFTGGLLVGYRFIDDLYVHMGFQAAWKFESVYELTFEEGKLEREKDCTQFMAEVREELRDRKLNPDHTDSQERILEWVKQMFSLDYRM